MTIIDGRELDNVLECYKEKTVKQVLEDINSSDLSYFTIKILTNEGNNDGYYNLFSSTYVLTENPKKEHSFENFIDTLCLDKDDRRVIRFLLDKPVTKVELIPVTGTNIANKYNIVIVI